MEDGEIKNIISWENVVYVADFFLKSGEQSISLLGGEPTLHPYFVDIALYLIDRGFHVNVFTSGVLGKAKLAAMEKYLIDKPKESLSFVCNLNNPIQTSTPKKETESLHRFLATMGHLVGPGFTIYRTDFELDFIFDLVLKYGLNKHLRLGLAHPIPGAGNDYISPTDISGVIDRLYSYRQIFERLRIKVGLDCGFPMCRLTDEQLGWLYRLTGPKIRFSCGMPLDIAPDMSIYNCFPLSTYHRKSLFDFDSLAQIVDFFHKRMEEIRSEIPGIYPACDSCIHRQEKLCDGGGACQLLNRMTTEPPIRLPEINDGLALFSHTA